MPTEMLTNVITQNLAALTMAVIFIWYLVKRDRANDVKEKNIQQTFKDFNKTIQNHLKHALDTEVKVSKSLQELSTCIKQVIKNDNKK